MFRRSVLSTLQRTARTPTRTPTRTLLSTFTNFRPVLTSVPVPTRLYHERVIDHYENPRNVGSLSVDDPNVGTGLVGAPACGDVMKLQLRADPVTGQIVEAKFKTFGCGSAIASSSFATEWVQGKTIDDALKVKNSDIAKHLSLPPVKLHCSMLAEDAIKAAIANLKEKRVKLQQHNGSSGSPQHNTPPQQHASAKMDFTNTSNKK